MSLPTVITTSGLQPQAPADLRAQLLASTAAMAPGYTVLPGVLIEDISSTQVAGLAQMDAARVEFFNSLTPYSANPFILNQLGVQYGVLPGLATNTSVYLIFSGTPGYLIAPSFTVSDGTNQYICPEGGVIGSAGVSGQIFAVCTQPGTFAVPANTVTALVTSVATGFSLTVTNPQAGIPGAAAQAEQDYRTAVLQAGLASAQGTPRFIKTLLGNVPGVQPRLVSVQQASNGFWKVIVGGGDQYAVANAIYQAVFDVNKLAASVTNVTNISNANPGVVSTDIAHGLSTGTATTIAGVVGMTGVNGTFSITALTPHSFSIGVNTTSSGSYVSGGVVTPNYRNLSVSLYDYPDTYTVQYINPPQQTVTMSITWNTTSPNYVSPQAITAAVQPAMASYVNSIPVGQPLNLFDMQDVFRNATAGIVPNNLLDRMVFVVAINGITVSPITGTGLYAGEIETYFYASQTGITVTQG